MGWWELFDGTTQLGAAVASSEGVAAFDNITSLSVGTHAISAHYLGDSSTLASQSGAVNVTVTGTTTVGISTNSASSNSNATVGLTIS
jgi:Bacterial Ig-like domain (group 3)